MEKKYTTSRELQIASAWQITSLTSVITTIIFSIQSLLVGYPLKSWQLIFLLSNLILTALFLVQLKLNKRPYLLFAPLINILLAPIWIGENTQKSWMSIGLITMIIGLCIAAIFEKSQATFGIILIGIIHLLISRMNYVSISDLADTNLAYGYFSLIWNSGAALALVYARARYIEICDDIDDQIDNRYIELLNQTQKITKINRKDWRNLKLHGTLLNTLISARNLTIQGVDISDLAGTISTEIDELATTAEFKKDLYTQLKELAKSEYYKNINFEIKGDGDFAQHESTENYIEIIREILLNTVKHSNLKRVEIEYQISSDKDIWFSIQTYENTPFLASAQKSNTLRRLLEPLEGNLEIGQNQNGLKYIFQQNSSKEEPINISKIQLERNTGVKNVALDLSKVVAVIATLSAIGILILTGISIITFSILIQALLIDFVLITNFEFKWVFNISSLISMILIPYIFLTNPECGQINYLPWVFDASLLSAFMAGMNYKNSIARWLPLITLTASSLIQSFQLPSNCQDILLGSIPGIPIILLLILRLNYYRNKVIKDDLENLLGIYVDEKRLVEIQNELNFEFQELLNKCKELVGKIAENSGNLSDLIEIRIQMIRNFLLSSEQFESNLIRNYYHFVKSRLFEGTFTRASIVGNNFVLDNHDPVIASILFEIGKVTANKSIQIELRDTSAALFKVTVAESDLKLVEELNAIGKKYKGVGIEVGVI